jgi:hypothetical protein
MSEEALYRYQFKEVEEKESEWDIEITFLIPVSPLNFKKFVKVQIVKDTISVTDTRTSQPIILGTLYDQIADSNFTKIDVVRNNVNYGEVTITLEKKNKFTYWPLLIRSSKGSTFNTNAIDDQSEFLLAITNRMKDPSFSAQCLLNSAEKGNESALFEYATHCSGIPEWKVGINTASLQIEADESKSIKYYERFLDFQPQHYLVNYRVGFLYKNFKNDLTKAKPFLQQSFQRTNGTYPDAALALAQILYEENNHKGAVAFYRYALKENLTDPKLDELFDKFKKEELERQAAEELKEKEEKELAEKKLLQEQEAIRIQEVEKQRALQEIERNNFYAYTFGALVAGAIGLGIYWSVKNNK